MISMNGNFVCGVSDSAVVRSVGMNGIGERVYIGHCAPVTRVEALSERLFASAAQDDSIRVWDGRDRTPLLTVLLPHVTVTAMTGSTDYVIVGFKNKVIGVVSLTGERSAPVLAIHTQDFTPFKMVFDQKQDALYMYAVRETDHRQPFGEANRKGKQTVFRKYAAFVRVPRPGERQGIL
jgi:hypothetical protein